VINENFFAWGTNEITLVKTQSYIPLQLKENQRHQISSAERMQAALRRDDCVGFYAVENGRNIAFALLRRFDADDFFLWNILVDSSHQGQGKGAMFLRLLIVFLRDEYCAKIVTTTYKFGNAAAKRLYESLGFVETDIVCEDGVHEVNMELILSSERIS